MNDPRLDRLIEFDERSRNYPVRALLTPRQLQRPPRSYTWSVPVVLDQGNEGACVGFSWANELAARPTGIVGVTNTIAQEIYYEARKVDEWDGEDYEGTSVLAGAKVVHDHGYMDEYRWAFGIDDLIRAVAYKGPAVLGLNWYTGMMRPDSDGRIRPTGDVEGGHAILHPRVTSETYRIKSMRNRHYLYNSWGTVDGWPWAWLSRDDMERLLNENGEACVPVVRKYGKF